MLPQRRVRGKQAASVMVEASIQEDYDRQPITNGPSCLRKRATRLDNVYASFSTITLTQPGFTRVVPYNVINLELASKKSTKPFAKKDSTSNKTRNRLLPHHPGLSSAFAHMTAAAAAAPVTFATDHIPWAAHLVQVAECDEWHDRIQTVLLASLMQLGHYYRLSAPCTGPKCPFINSSNRLEWKQEHAVAIWRDNEIDRSRAPKELGSAYSVELTVYSNMMVDVSKVRKWMFPRIDDNILTQLDGINDLDKLVDGIARILRVSYRSEHEILRRSYEGSMLSLSSPPPQGMDTVTWITHWDNTMVRCRESKFAEVLTPRLWLSRALQGMNRVYPEWVSFFKNQYVEDIYEDRISFEKVASHARAWHVLNEGQLPQNNLPLGMSLAAITPSEQQHRPAINQNSQSARVSSERGPRRRDQKCYFCRGPHANNTCKYFFRENVPEGWHPKGSTNMRINVGMQNPGSMIHRIHARILASGGFKRDPSQNVPFQRDQPRNGRGHHHQPVINRDISEYVNIATPISSSALAAIPALDATPLDKATNNYNSMPEA
ncbi:uncharacterized protein BROUX77_003369 [Berkeleyomyces rouxiae]|uniref:uncharacterized protein n=1 Tax=Berkeleyomyces rouxiae TaxID=2035830 RepID=UPI003B7B61FB